MSKRVLAIALTLVFIIGAVVVYMANNPMSKIEGTSGAKNLLGATVKNPYEEVLGTITDYVQEPDGRITFAILNFGHFEDYGEGGRRIAVPYSALSCPGLECTLDATYEKLASAPAFISKDELTEWRLAEDLHRYFGVTPPWTEEESSAPEIDPYPYLYP